MTTASPPPVTIRPLTSADAPALQAVYGASGDYFKHATGHTARDVQAAQDLADAADDDARHVLGIYLRETMAGVIDLRLAGPEPFDVHLGLILLAEPNRRQGLGSWALRIVEEWLRQATPTEAVVLTVAAQDSIAQAFFRQLGYDFTGQAVRVLSHDSRTRLLVMRKEIRQMQAAPASGADDSGVRSLPH